MNHRRRKGEDNMSLRPRGNQLWKKHVEMYVEVFRQALIALSKIKQAGKSEPAISCRLNKLVRRKCFESGKELVFPIYEVPIFADLSDDDSKLKEAGRPDFTCRLKDKTATSCSNSELDFHIECKCLGRPKSSSWIFNENYVNHGIMRFDQDDKRYGENVPNGMMIGYILSMCTDDICKEVNEELKKTKRKYSSLCFQSSSGLLKETSQQLVREIVSPANFAILHLWIVLNPEN